MAQSVNDIIERVYRRYLTPMFDQPVATTLQTAINASTATVILNPFASIEYADMLSKGTIIELGLELMRIEAATEPASASDTITLTVTRGLFGSIPATAAVDSQVTVAPTFTRLDVYLSVQDEIEALYPDLWTLSYESFDQAPYEIPSDYVDLLECTIEDSEGQLWPVHSARVAYSDGDPYLVLGSQNTGYTVHVTYVAKPLRPTQPSNVLTSLNVEDRWADIVAMGAAIQHVTGQNISDLRADYLTEISEISVSEAVGPNEIATALWRARALRMNEERRRLKSQHRSWTQMRTSLGV